MQFSVWPKSFCMHRWMSQPCHWLPRKSGCMLHWSNASAGLQLSLLLSVNCILNTKVKWQQRTEKEQQIRFRNATNKAQEPHENYRIIIVYVYAVKCARLVCVWILPFAKFLGNYILFVVSPRHTHTHTTKHTLNPLSVEFTRLIPSHHAVRLCCFVTCSFISTAIIIFAHHSGSHGFIQRFFSLFFSQCFSFSFCVCFCVCEIESATRI